MIAAWVLYGHTEGVLQMSSALDMVMCLWNTLMEISQGQLDTRVIGKSDPVLALERLAIE